VKEAFETGKEVWMVDALEKSPFLKHFSHAIFPDEKQLFAFLDEHGFSSVRKKGLYSLPKDWKRRYGRFLDART